MAVRQRVDKSFSITGPVSFIKSDRDKNGRPYVLLTVAGVGFFLPEEFHSEANHYEEGMRLTVRGEVGGTTVRNGQRQAVFDIYEILPGDGIVAPPTVHANGNGAIPRIDKGQPA